MCLLTPLLCVFGWTERVKTSLGTSTAARGKMPSVWQGRPCQLSTINNDKTRRDGTMYNINLLIFFICPHQQDHILQTHPLANKNKISLLFSLQSFQQKFFHSKEIIAISCSWCKQAVSVVWGGSWHCFRPSGLCVYRVLTPVSDALLLSSTTRWLVSCCNRSRNLALWAHMPESLYLPRGLLKSGSHRYSKSWVTKILYIVCFFRREPCAFVGNVSNVKK